MRRSMSRTARCDCLRVVFCLLSSVRGVFCMQIYILPFQEDTHYHNEPLTGIASP
jgi:hypothetical protein